MQIRNGRFKGKGNTSLGRMTAYELNGLNILRSVPATVKQPNTEEFRARKDRFGALSDLVKGLSPVFRMKTFPMKDGQNYRNPASTANSPAVTCALGSSPVIDYEALKLSKGSLAGQSVAANYSSSTNTITLTWTANTAFGAASTDRVYAAVVSDTDDLVSAIEDDARSANTIVISTAGMPAGKSLYLYVFVKSTNGSFWSDSIYVQKFSIS